MSRQRGFWCEDAARADLQQGDHLHVRHCGRKRLSSARAARRPRCAVSRGPAGTGRSVRRRLRVFMNTYGSQDPWPRRGDRAQPPAWSVPTLGLALAAAGWSRSVSDPSSRGWGGGGGGGGGGEQAAGAAPVDPPSRSASPMSPRLDWDPASSRKAPRRPTLHFFVVAALAARRAVSRRRARHPSP